MRAVVAALWDGKGVTGDSGSWIPGVETGCTGSASCTKLSQWSNYWKWSVTSGEVPELQSDLGSQWSMPCTSSPVLHSPAHPSAANSSLVTSRGAGCCFWLKMLRVSCLWQKPTSLQDFPMHSTRETLINEGHTLWCDEAADTFCAARRKALLGFLKITGENFHISQERYWSHHEITFFWISLGWVKMN